MTSSGSPLLEARQRRLAFGRRPHLIALAAQHGLQHARDLRLIVDDEHTTRFRCVPRRPCVISYAMRARSPAASSASCQARVSRSRRQRQRDDRASSRQAASRQRSHHACASTRRTRNRQAETNADALGSTDSRPGIRKNFSNTCSRSSGGMPGLRPRRQIRARAAVSMARARNRDGRVHAARTCWRCRAGCRAPRRSPRRRRTTPEQPGVDLDHHVVIARQGLGARHRCRIDRLSADRPQADRLRPAPAGRPGQPFDERFSRSDSSSMTCSSSRWLGRAAASRRSL